MVLVMMEHTFVLNKFDAFQWICPLNSLWVEEYYDTDSILAELNNPEKLILLFEYDTMIVKKSYFGNT